MCVPGAWPGCGTSRWAVRGWTPPRPRCWRGPAWPSHRPRPGASARPCRCCRRCAREHRPWSYPPQTCASPWPSRWPRGGRRRGPVRAAAAGPGRVSPVLLVGGVARTPLLAELLDAAGVHDVRVADRPDAAAVLGALRVAGEPARAHRRERGAAVPRSERSVWRRRPPRRVGSRAGGPSRACPGPCRRRPGCRPSLPRGTAGPAAVLAALAAAAAVLGLLAAGSALPAATPATPRGSVSAAGGR